MLQLAAVSPTSLVPVLGFQLQLKLNLIFYFKLSRSCKGYIARTLKKLTIHTHLPIIILLVALENAQQKSDVVPNTFR